MRKLRLFAVLAFVCATLVPALGNAQETVTIDATYVGGNFESKFDYPKEGDLLSGKRYRTEGVRVEATVRVIENVAVGYRYERNELRGAEFFSSRSNNRLAVSEPDRESTGGTNGYQEIYGSFMLPRAYGHSLAVGFAEIRLDRTWCSELAGGYNYSLRNSHYGVVVGGLGKQKIGAVTFDYAGRFYPRLTRKDGEHPVLASSYGYEIRGTIAWMQSRHVGLIGGYQIRRLRTDVPPDRFWPINENQTSKSVVVGTRISF